MKTIKLLSLAAIASLMLASCGNKESQVADETLTTDVEKLENSANEAKAKFAEAEENLKKALMTGDSIAIERAQKIHDEAKTNWEKLKTETKQIISDTQNKAEDMIDATSDKLDKANADLKEASDKAKEEADKVGDKVGEKLEDLTK